MKRVSKQEDVDVVKFLSECTRESVRNKRESLNWLERIS